jgi:arsenite-transporting ATPase
MLSRAFPVDRRIEALVSERGMAEGAVEALAALDALVDQLRRVREFLVGPHAAVRLVATPERLVLAETRRSRATLALLGHRVEGLVLNRVAAGEDWPAPVVGRHRSALIEARSLLPGLPVRHVPYLLEEPVGVEALARLGSDVLAGADPLDLGAPPLPQGLRGDGDQWWLDVALPGADADDVAVAMTDRGDLVIDLGSHRRVLELPAVLRRCEVTGARLDSAEGLVRVAFRPDDRLWSTDPAQGEGR